jgi:hypothetical protein
MDSPSHDLTSNEKSGGLKASEVEKMSYSSDEKPLTRKQILSPYFTIAAAAFGLISDGCKFLNGFVILLQC